MNGDDSIHGLCVGVYQQKLGDQLAVAPASGATVLTVYDVGPFEPAPGYVQINSIVYAYTDCDDDANTITLATGLIAAAAVDDRVDLYDQANGQPAMVYNAIVSNLDGFPDPAPIEASVSDQLAHGLQQLMVDGNGVSVVMERNGSELEIVSILGRMFGLASMEYLQGGMTTRTGEDQPGVSVFGTGAGTAGLHVYGSTGLEQMAIVADPAGGLMQFWTGASAETGPASINPSISGGVNPQLIISSAGKSGVSHATITLIPGGIQYVTGGGGGQHTFDSPIEITNGSLIVDNGGVTVTGGHLQTDGTVQGATLVGTTLPTTTTAANVNYNAANGNLRQVTSLSEAKLDQQPITAEDARRVLDLTAKTWFDRGDAEAQGGTEGLPRIPGLIAEDVQEHTPELALHDLNGDLQGVAYDRVAALLIPIIRDQQERIERLEATVAELTRGD